MYYKKQDLSIKIKKRIMRRKRNRYHNDAELFSEDHYSTVRKRTISRIKNL